jgi:hypothetical protein
VHLLVATLIERSNFIAIHKAWFKDEHLERIMVEWLMGMLRPDGSEG